MEWLMLMMHMEWYFDDDANGAANGGVADGMDHVESLMMLMEWLRVMMLMEWLRVMMLMEWVTWGMLMERLVASELVTKSFIIQHKNVVIVFSWNDDILNHDIYEQLLNHAFK